MNLPEDWDMHRTVCDDCGHPSHPSGTETCACAPCRICRKILPPDQLVTEGTQRGLCDGCAEACRNDVLLDLLSIGSASNDIPRDRWQRWAARLYRNASAREHRLALPSMPPSCEANRIYREVCLRYTRLLCAALASRAEAHGWSGLAQDWADRYWDRTDEMDPPGPLQEMLCQIERFERIESLR